jgi:hypothetical protein
VLWLLEQPGPLPLGIIVWLLRLLLWRLPHCPASDAALLLL